MVFRRGLHPVISTKNVVDNSGLIAAITPASIASIVTTVDSATLADIDSVERGSSIKAFYLSIFFITEGGEVANEVPLVDWYIFKNNGGNFSGFSATDFPTPGATGNHDNKRFIIHEEKGLSGGGDASLAGVPMVFKGVLKIPRHMQKCNANDQWNILAQSNFATKFCVKCIYKWFH